MLQSGTDISNPTVLDVRAVYQFGAGVGPEVATAADSANIAQIVALIGKWHGFWSLFGNLERSQYHRQRTPQENFQAVDWR